MRYPRNKVNSKEYSNKSNMGSSLRISLGKSNFNPSGVNKAYQTETKLHKALFCYTGGPPQEP